MTTNKIQETNSNEPIPARVHALENKLNEEKAKEEKSFEDLKQSVSGKLPIPTGWRLLVLPFRGVSKTKGGLYLSDSTLERQQVATVCSYVLAVGSLAYKDEEKFPTGAWCKKGEWILHARYAGLRFHIEGGEVRILNDDEVLATIKDPDDILHLF